MDGVDQEEEELECVVLVRAGVLSVEIADDGLEIVQEFRGGVRGIVPECLQDLSEDLRHFEAECRLGRSGIVGYCVLDIPNIGFVAFQKKIGCQLLRVAQTLNDCIYITKRQRERAIS